jgi:hypothetical protein
VDTDKGKQREPAIDDALQAALLQELGRSPDGGVGGSVHSSPAGRQARKRKRGEDEATDGGAEQSVDVYDGGGEAEGREDDDGRGGEAEGAGADKFNDEDAVSRTRNYGDDDDDDDDPFDEAMHKRKAPRKEAVEKSGVNIANPTTKPTLNGVSSRTAAAHVVVTARNNPEQRSAGQDRTTAASDSDSPPPPAKKRRTMARPSNASGTALPPDLTQPQRISWSRADTDTLVSLMAMYRCSWAAIESHDRRRGVFEVPRGQQAYRDKARNLKVELMM